MLTSLLTLFGGGLGGLLRFVPELFKLFTDKRDRDHEYRMTSLQLEIDKARAEQDIDKVHAVGEVANQLQEMQAYIAAIGVQGQKTGIGWVDALNATVRPVMTYWWLSLFTGYKLASIYNAWNAPWDQFVSALWTTNDAGILSLIIGFWFVDRAIRKQQGT